jgi:hypothetical protein
VELRVGVTEKTFTDSKQITSYNTGFNGTLDGSDCFGRYGREIVWQSLRSIGAAIARHVRVGLDATI